jgi:DNA-directed RNA polymerase subunit RPC12/RpoP
MLKFSCGACSTTLQTPDDKAGQLVRCPNCKTALRVPTPSLSGSTGGSTTGPASSARSPLAPPDVAINPPPAAPTSRPMPPEPPPIERAPLPPQSALPVPRDAGLPKTGGRRYGFHCQYCSSRLEATDAQAGTQGNCPTCGNEIVVPILDRYGRLIDPMTGQVVKQDPHPVHAYAANGQRAPNIVRTETGKQMIECPRCKSTSDVSVNNCRGCGMPFTMEGTAITSDGSANGFSVASLVLGIIGLPASCTVVLPALAILFGIIGYVQSSKNEAGGGKTMPIIGIVLGCIGVAIGVRAMF